MRRIGEKTIMKRVKIQKGHIDVAIVMGSDSDWPIVESASKTLKEFAVRHEVRVISAHRTPELATAYAAGAARRGIKVIIAAAGGAAHLGGVIAAHTTLPVIERHGCTACDFADAGRYSCCNSHTGKCRAHQRCRSSSPDSRHRSTGACDDAEEIQAEAQEEGCCG